MSAILITPQRPGLGRHHVADARDHGFLLRTAAPEIDPHTLPSKSWPLFAHWLDQGETGACVNFAWLHYLIGTPQPMRLADLPPRFAIYDRAIQVDEFPENDHDTARRMGTSVRAGAKALQELGLISGYGWEFAAAGAIRWLATTGGLVTGFNWYDSMFERDREGFLRIAPGARKVGGHSTYAYRWDRRRGAIGLYTSWRDIGPFLLSGEDFARLLEREEGEACAAIEVPHTTRKAVAA